MIAPAPQPTPRVATNTQDMFLAMLPRIRAIARHAFRHENPESRDNLIAEVVANAFVNFTRLVKRGKAEVAHPTPLAVFGIRQVRVGRQVGCKLNIRDVCSLYAQLAKGIRVERLDQRDADGQWQELLVEDRKSGPAEVAATRIDVSNWFKLLGRRKARIAKALARGESPNAVAHMFGISPGRVSQLRDEFRRSWRAFRGEDVAA